MSNEQGSIKDKKSKFLFFFEVEQIKHSFYGVPTTLAVVIILLLALITNITFIVNGSVDSDNIDNMVISSIRLIPGLFLIICLASNSILFGNLSYVFYAILFKIYFIYFAASFIFYIISPPGPIDDFNKDWYYATFYCVYVFGNMIYLVIDCYFLYIIFHFVESLQKRSGLTYKYSSVSIITNTKNESLKNYNVL